MESYSRPRRPAAILMHITVDTSCLNTLRQVVTAHCGALLSFMRVEPVEHARRMKVWLCVPPTLLRQMMDAVMRQLPAAEFGRIRQVQ